MASDSDDAHIGEGYVRCLQISVFVYGFVNILVRGAELLLAIISSSVILATYISGINHASSFHDYLNQEAKHVLWRGPFENIAILQNSASMSSSNSTDNQTVTIIADDFDETQEKINLHVWCTFLLMKCITVAFGLLLIFSAKKFSFSGSLAWLSFSSPVLAQYLLQLILDFSLGDYLQRELPSQIWQGVDTGFQFLGVFTVSIFIHQLYHMDDKIQGIDRYNGFPSSGINGDISITEIVEDSDDQRFK